MQLTLDSTQTISLLHVDTHTYLGFTHARMCLLSKELIFLACSTRLILENNCKTKIKTNA